jgi:hypothetical protein
LWVWCGQPPESYVCNINMGSRRFSKHQPQSDQIHRLDRLSMYWRRLFSQCWSIDILCLIPYLIFLIYYFVVWIIHLHLSSNTQINLTKKTCGSPSSFQFSSTNLPVLGWPDCQVRNHGLSGRVPSVSWQLIGETLAGFTKFTQKCSWSNTHILRKWPKNGDLVL